MKNGTETDVDCGGSCSPCINTKDCLVAGDCQSGFCNALVCAACATDAQCGTGNYCDTTSNGGTCSATRSNAKPCTAGDQCASGFCANGVCCDQACTGTCQGCTLALTGTADGTCASYKPGTTAPSGQCSSSPPCGNDGKCAAGGTCEQAPSATPRAGRRRAPTRRATC